MYSDDKHEKKNNSTNPFDKCLKYPYWSMFFMLFTSQSCCCVGHDTLKSKTCRKYFFYATIVILLIFLGLGFKYADGSLSPSFYNAELNIVGFHYDKVWLLIICVIFSFILQITIQYRRVEGFDKYTQAYNELYKFADEKKNAYECEWNAVYDVIQYDMKNVLLFIISLLFLISQNIWIILGLFFGSWIGESIAFIKVYEKIKDDSKENRPEYKLFQKIEKQLLEKYKLVEKDKNITYVF